MSIVICNINSSYDTIAKNLSEILGEKIFLITEKEDLTIDYLNKITPRFIFFPHWSFFIPERIFQNYECVVFHMTDLPFGRGGSPLQNLIIRGITETKISAIKVIKELDAGPIYLKENLDLTGTAKEIFEKCTPIIQNMILKIAKEKITPIEQLGDPLIFKRRKPEESDISLLDDTDLIYDYIRMLDADGYPNAFLETDKIRLEFRNAILHSDKTIKAHVRITKK